MTEERRVEPAATGAIPPVADVEEALDEAELEEVPVAKVPPVARKSQASQPPAAEASAPSRMRDSSPGNAKRGRRGMSLRIPDDEISRPTPSVAPAQVAPAQATPSQPSPSAPSPPFAQEPPAVAIQPMRIVSIEAPSKPADDFPLRAASIAEPARGAPAPGTKGAEDSWTPFQPLVADEPAAGARATSGTQQVAEKAPSSEELIPISSEVDLESSGGPTSAEPLELDDAETHATLSSRPPPPVASPAADELPTMKSLPVGKHSSAPPPPRATTPTEPEGEEVRFDDDEAAPAAAAGDRTSEPGDAAEISAEDMVSVESVPAPRVATQPQPTSGLSKALAPPTPPVAFVPPPMRPRAQSVPSIPPPVPPVAAVTPPKAIPSPPLTPRPPLVIVPPHSGVQAPQSDTSSRRKARPWWEDLFNDDYVRTMAKITPKQIGGECTFIEDSLGVAKGGTMLDLACGTGAHAIELAARGYEVVGFDLSLAMLARAADDAQESEAKLNFVQGDMREMSFDESFDGVYCWNTSFGFFDEETNAKVIGKIHKSLKKGGQFLLDVANRDFIAKQAPSLAWFEGDGCVCMDEMQIDWITSRMRVKRTLMMDDGRSKEIEYSVRLYALHELGRILHEQGFRVAEVSGRTATAGVFFGAESPRTIILAEKR